MNYKKELLSPVGSLESLHAAVNAGADAIYTGGRMFGARAYANNFDTEELIEAIRFCHMHNVALYLTVNTLLTDEELGMLYDFLNPIYLAGLDAVIVQDIGVLEYISRVFPDLKIHLSTQFTSATHLSSDLFRDKNVTRIVTPRELSLKEIEEYHKNSDLEIETFIHGALCYCYSGQCMMSYLVGGRSGNRGKCAQPCRRIYSLDHGNVHISGAFLSTKDICALPILPQLMESPIYSFKIEGRMKKPEYVAVTTSVYRKYMDLYEKYGKDYNDYIKKSSEYHNDVIRLSDIYNRGGFANSYFFKHNDTEMMSGNIVNHYGTLVGTVSASKKGSFSVTFHEKVNPADVLVVRDLKKVSSKDIYEFTLPADFNGAYYTGNCYSNVRILRQMPVYRIRNNSLIKEMNERFIIKDKKIGISMEFEAVSDKPVSLTMIHNDIRIKTEGDVPLKAQKTPVSKENVREKLSKLGDTPFCLESDDDLSIIIEEGLFIPASKLNELRRSAAAKLEETLKNQKKRLKDLSKDNALNIDKTFDSHTLNNIRYIVLPEEMNELLSSAKINSYETVILEASVFMNELKPALIKLKRLGLKTCTALPHIIRYEYIDKAMSMIKAMEEYRELIDCILVRNLEGLSMIKDSVLKEKLIISDRNLYAFNAPAYDRLHELGVDMVVAPLENPKAKADISSYDGYRLAMITAGCVNKNTSGCDKMTKKIFMSNEKKDRYCIVNVCSFCYNLIFDINGGDVI